MLYLQSFPCKGVLVGYVGRDYKLKDLKAVIANARPQLQGYLAHKKTPTT
jgi:hypothetical protein